MIGKNKKITVLVVAAAIILVVSMFYIKPPTETVIGVSEVYIDPQGKPLPEHGEEFVGAYWIILMTADMADEVSAIKFGNAEEEPGKTYVEGSDGIKVYAEDEVEDEVLVPLSEITIKIEPLQPYYARQMEISSVEMAPATVGAWRHPTTQAGKRGAETAVEEVFTGHYEFTTDSRWEKHTPFSMVIEKNGEQVWSGEFNTEGGETTASIDVEGKLLVKDLGRLSGIYGDPTFNDILYFTDEKNHGIQQIFLADTLARSLVASSFPTGSPPGGKGLEEVEVDCYASYWYGSVYWKDDGTPTPFVLDPMDIVGPDVCGGWYDPGSSLWTQNRDPIAPVVWDKSSLPDDKKSFYSLVQYLESRGAKKVVKGSYVDIFKRSDDDKLEVDVPFSAINEGSEVFAIYIPTELADTIVWSPPVSDVKIESIDSPAELMQMSTGSITLSQSGNVRSTAVVKISFDPPRTGLSVQPNNFGVTLDPDEIQTVSLVFYNTGSDEEKDVAVTFKVTDAFTGAVTDSETITVKLLKRTGQTAVLIVHTVDIDTGDPVPNIHVMVTWDSQSKEDYTGIGGQKAFDMGNLVGAVVSATASENEDYFGSAASITLQKGPNDLLLELKSKAAEEDGGFDWGFWPIVMGVIIATVIPTTVVLIYMKKRKASEET